MSTRERTLGPLEPAPRSPFLCHLPGTSIKDLQTNFPETFRACSCMYRSCFTNPRFRLFSRNFTQNAPHPNTCPPRELREIRRGLCHLMSPCVLQDLRAFDRAGRSPQAEPKNMGRDSHQHACEKGISHERRAGAHARKRKDQEQEYD